MVEVKERLENGIDVLSISNSHLTVEVTNFGCTLLKIVTKDKNDQDCDCILGFEHVEDYQKRDGTYLNALVGRVCNRIEKGTFTMNGTEYHVPINNGPNSLHLCDLCDTGRESVWTAGKAVSQKIRDH